jgi:hypothetical protein
VKYAKKPVSFSAIFTKATNISKSLISCVFFVDITDYDVSAFLPNSYVVLSDLIPAFSRFVISI